MADARKTYTPDGVQVIPGSSAVVTAGGFAFTGSLMAFGSDLRLDSRAVQRPFGVYETDLLELQSRVLLGQLRATLAAIDCSGSDVMRIWQWMPSEYPSDEDYRRGPVVWPEFYPGDGYVREAAEVFDSIRTSTGIGVRMLPLEAAMMAVEVQVALPRAGVEKVGFPNPAVDNAETKLPFVSTVRHGDWITAVGTGSDLVGDWPHALHRGEPSLVAAEARVNPYIWLGSEIASQTDFALRQLKRSAERAGSSLDHCVHAEVTLLHPDDYPDFERVWRRWFPERAPARRLTTGARIVAKGVRVEIGMTFLAADSDIPIETISHDGVTPPVGHTPLAVRAGQLTFVSTRLPLDSNHTVAPELRTESARRYLDRPTADQAAVILDDLEAICLAAGSELANVCKLQVNMADLATLPDFLDVFSKRFPHDPPALSVIGVGGGQPLLAAGADLQIDAVVWSPEAAGRTVRGLPSQREAL